MPPGPVGRKAGPRFPQPAEDRAFSVLDRASLRSFAGRNGPPAVAFSRGSKRSPPGDDRARCDLRGPGSRPVRRRSPRRKPVPKGLHERGPREVRPGTPSAHSLPRLGRRGRLAIRPGDDRARKARPRNRAPARNRAQEARTPRRRARPPEGPMGRPVCRRLRDEPPGATLPLPEARREAAGPARPLDFEPSRAPVRPPCLHEREAGPAPADRLPLGRDRARISRETP